MLHIILNLFCVVCLFHCLYLLLFIKDAAKFQEILKNTRLVIGGDMHCAWIYETKVVNITVKLCMTTRFSSILVRLWCLTP